MATRSVQFGKHCVADFGPAGSGAMLTPLTDSSALLAASDWGGLQAALRRDGYLFLPGALPTAHVEAARDHVLGTFVEKGGILDASQPVKEGVLKERCGLGCVPFMEGRNEVTHSEPLLQVFEGERIKEIFAGVLGAGTRSFDFKWLRAMPHDAFTGAHMDNVYMGRGSPKLLTCWVPFGENPVEMGSLAVCEGSHNLAEFEKLRATYGQMDHESDKLDGSGWFTENPAEVLKLFGGQWKTADFKAGDLLTFTMHTMHMSTTNVTNKVRISADIRFQPADEPIDTRYCGDLKQFLAEMTVAGAWSAAEDEVGGEDSTNTELAQKLEAAKEEEKVTIGQLREKWGYPLAEGVELK